MKTCPTCGGSGSISDDSIDLRPQQTGGLANRELTPNIMPDKINRIISAVNRIDSLKEPEAKTLFSPRCLAEVRKYLQWILAREKVTSEELASGYWDGTPSVIAGRHKTMRGICRAVHAELRLEMLIERKSFQGKTTWTLRPLGETIAKSGLAIINI